MSRPMIRLSSRGSSFSHSRTGSRPAADLQNATGMASESQAFRSKNVSKKIHNYKRQMGLNCVFPTRQFRHNRFLDHLRSPSWRLPKSNRCEIGELFGEPMSLVRLNS